MNVRARVAKRVGVEFVRVEHAVAEILDGGYVVLVSPRPRCDRDIQARVLALLGGRVTGGNLELLDVIRVDAEHIIGGNGVGGLVGLDTVDGHIAGHGTCPIHRDGCPLALRNARLEYDQVQRVPAI